MGKLLTILGISQEVQDKLPNDVLEGEQFLNVLQAVYEQSPESKKKDALAQAIAENVRLLLEEVSKVKIEDKIEEKEIKKELPFKVGDVFRRNFEGEEPPNTNIVYEITEIDEDDNGGLGFVFYTVKTYTTGTERFTKSPLQKVIENVETNWWIPYVEKTDELPTPNEEQTPDEEPTPDDSTPPSEPTPPTPKTPKTPKVDRKKERIKKELQEQIAEIRETLSLFSEEEEEYQELQNELSIISEQINQLNN